MLHWAKGVGEADVVVVKVAGVGVTSAASTRLASRNPFRPLPGVGVGVDVDKIKVLAGEIVTNVGAGDGVTNGAGTIPLPIEGEFTTVPRLTPPLTLIRTGGRRYPGVKLALTLASVRSQVSRNGFHKLGTRSQLIPPVAGPVVAVPATGQMASELRYGNLLAPTASITVGVEPTFTVHAIRTG